MYATRKYFKIQGKNMRSIDRGKSLDKGIVVQHIGSYIVPLASWVIHQEIFSKRDLTKSRMEKISWRLNQPATVKTMCRSSRYEISSNLVSKRSPCDLAIITRKSDKINIHLSKHVSHCHSTCWLIYPMSLESTVVLNYFGGRIALHCSGRSRKVTSHI